ncbi:MAG: hypothetical protein M1819_002308 [Sarea resinae]|nr:MAG: hypothetical protein M1819_002308 [Sarea resinae]
MSVLFRSNSQQRFTDDARILASSLPLARRPMFVASYSSMYGIATVTAPLMGGAFTDRLTWRWCFFINLPFGAITLVVICFFFASPAQPSQEILSPTEKLKQFDISGTAVLIVGIACLLLALQWGGSRYDWSNARIIALLTLFGVSAVVFVLIQFWKGEYATVPPRIFKKRSVAFSAWHVFAAGAAMNVLEYFLPIWFQAIKGVSALNSGIRILPTIFGVVVFSYIAGFGVSRLGYYTPFMIIGSAFLSIGCGLITSWQPSSSVGQWVGYQILLGAGGGLAIQQAHSAAQTVLKPADVPTGAVVIIFAQILGGTLFISTAQSVLDNRLSHGLRASVPQVNPKVVLAVGATRLQHVVGPQYLPLVLKVYNRALTQTFYVAVALAVVSMVGALGTEWRSVKKPAVVVDVDVTVVNA